MNGPSTTQGKVIVSGILFWFPLAGVTYQFLHYLIGLERLGYEVYYVEDSGRWVYDPRINDITGDPSGNIAAVVPILEKFGFGDRWVFRGNYPDGQCYGMTEDELSRLYKDADILFNVTASQEIRDEHADIPHKLYVESDPFPAQVKGELGVDETRAFLAAHDIHFTFGENIGADDCWLPTLGMRWHPTRQPVVLDLWEPREDGREAPYTTITTWHNKGKDLTYHGETYYWTKDREFMKVIDLPRRRPEAFELAVVPDDEAKTLLVRNGWRLTPSTVLSADFDAYRSYIEGSRGEFTVARDQYVRPRTGWFSDRSACYLAAGRPVITQETGFSKYLPTGEGLFPFTSEDDVDLALDAIASDYPANCRAARAIAAEYFGAEGVLTRMLEAAGLR